MKERVVNARKNHILWALLLCVSVLAGGCETGRAPEKKAGLPVIGVFLYSEDDVYVSLVSQALRTALEGRAVVVLRHARADQIVQNDQISEALKQGMDALAVNLVEPYTVTMPLKEAQACKIPVVFFNREPDLSTIKTYEKAAFVGTEAREAGEIQGRIIRELWQAHPRYDRNGDGIVQYVLLQGNSESPEALARTEFSVKEARRLGVPMQQLGETFICDWSRVQARQAMRVFWPVHGKSVEFVLSNNDSMALGALDVLREQGYNAGDPEKFLPIIGVDAIPEAVDAIRKGDMSATVRQDGESMGRVVAEMLLNAVAHKDFLDGLPHAWDASGVAVRIPYAPIRP